MTTQAIQKVDKAPVTITGCLQSQKWKDELMKVLPQYLTPEMVLRVAMTVSKESKFANCTPESFFAALLKCGRAGLVPDGRNAHLIPFGNEVQAIFDWKGLVAMAKRNGVEVTPKLVHVNDSFSVQEDDGSGQTRVVHAVDFSKPRGEILLVYSRAKTIKSGEIDYEFMTAEEVENIRQVFSKQKDSLMWKNSWGEGAKKTVIRRHSKRWDLSPEDRAAMNSDDDSPDFNDKPTFAKPLFGAATKPATLPAPEPEEKPEGEKNKKDEVLKLLRVSLTSQQITEGKLLEFLNNSGETDGSHTTLDEVPNDVLERIVSKWTEIVPLLKGGAK